MEEQVLVTMLYEHYNEKQSIYALNSILMQEYSNISLLILCNKNTHISLASLLETIESQRKENTKEVIIEFLNDAGFFQCAADYIWNYACSKEMQYASVLVNGDAFFQSDSLSRLMDLRDDEAMLFGNTVIYNIQGNYDSEYANYCNNPKSPVDYMEVFRRGIGLDTESRKFNHTRIGGVLYLPYLSADYRMKSPDKRVRFAAEVPVLRYQKELDYDKSDNYTTAHILETCSLILSKRHFEKNEIDVIEEMMAYLLSHADGKWGLSAGDQQLLVKLKELLEINKLVFRKKRLKTLKFNDSKKRIRVVFFCQEYQSWPSLKPVYERACGDARYETMLVYVPYHHFNSDSNKVNNGILNYLNAGYPVVNYADYDLCRHNPDVAVFVSPYSYVPEGFDIEAVQKVVHRCIYIPYGIIMESHSPELVRLRYRLPMQCLAWRVICDDMYGVEFAKKHSYGNGNNYVALGNPRIDFVRELPLKDDGDYIASIRQRAANRKIVLWNTHHSIDDVNTGFSSWKKYGEAVLAYFENHADTMFLLWRPHPYFMNALKKHLGNERMKEFMDKVQKADNIMVDEYKTYSAGFSVADLFISDQSSLVKEFLFTEKPIVITVMKKEDVVNRDLVESAYVPETIKEFNEIMDKFDCGEDIKLEKRKAYINNLNIKRDGCIAENILNYIYDQMNSELERLKWF